MHMWCIDDADTQRLAIKTEKQSSLCMTHQNPPKRNKKNERASSEMQDGDRCDQKAEDRCKATMRA